MSVDAFAYVRRLAFGKNPGRKLVLANIAEAVDKETHSWVIRPATLAIESEMEQRQTQNHLKDLMQAGYISALERFNDQGKQRPSRMLMHGPWDLWGGTGQPFEEVVLPRTERRLDTYEAREVDEETRKELRRRLQHIADREGFYSDGKPRARWRLGSRAHSIVCWYGVDNTVTHRGRVARVVEITDRDGRKKAPLRVRLDYGSGDTAWVLVSDLDEPTKNATGGKTSSAGVQPSAPTPEAGVQPSASHGVQPSASHGVQPSASRPPHYSSESRHLQEAPPSQRVPKEDEEESPSAQKPTPHGEDPADLIRQATDATAEEAAELIEILRPEVKKSMNGLIRHMAENKDLGQRLWMLRRQRASEARAAASVTPRGVCSLHAIQGTCPACRDELRGGGDLAAAVIAMYNALGDNRDKLRPDLAANPHIQALTNA